MDELEQKKKPWKHPDNDINLRKFARLNIVRKTKETTNYSIVTSYKNFRENCAQFLQVIFPVINQFSNCDFSILFV